MVGCAYRESRTGGVTWHHTVGRVRLSITALPVTSRSPPAPEEVRQNWRLEVWRGGRGDWNLKAIPRGSRVAFTVTDGHIPPRAPFEEVLTRQLRRYARQGICGADRKLKGGWSGPVPEAAQDAAYRILAAWLVETPEGREAAAKRG